jgi:hypothetical protein
MPVSPGDPGYFEERLAASRRALLQAWLRRTKALEARFSHTDVLGALVLASQIFQAQPKGRKILVIFSDMRENAGNLNLDERNFQNARLSFNRYAEGRGIPDLHGVEVHVLGADNAGKSMPYWTALRDFWTHYLAQAGANLKSYSVLRDAPDLAR